MISAEDLCNTFVEVADTLVADFGLIDFLYNLSQHAATICEAPAAGILLADEHDKLRYVAASNEQVKLVELFQIQNSEGPCFDCFDTGEPVINSDLSKSLERWPEFAPRAIEAGFSSVHAIPMRLREQVIGTLNIFGEDSRLFDVDEVRVVQSLADVASIAILQARSVRRAETLSEQLRKALDSRVVIEQAKGALSRMRAVTPDQAFELIRDFAREHRRRLDDVAEAVVTEPASLPALTQPAR
jgi:GAF domain-containing protein